MHALNHIPVHDVADLVEAVQARCGGAAEFVCAERVPLGDGYVEVCTFALQGLCLAQRAYAWREDGRPHVVFHLPTIASPREAVQRVAAARDKRRP
ncbi:MAG: hypothetical protein AB7O98_00600 [Hyphomonadaceae bacterium]